MNSTCWESLNTKDLETGCETADETTKHVQKNAKSDLPCADRHCAVDDGTNSGAQNKQSTNTQ